MQDYYHTVFALQGHGTQMQIWVGQILEAKAKIFQEAMLFHHHFYFPEVNIQVQNWNGVLKSLVSCLKWMKLASRVLYGNFWGGRILVDIKGEFSWTK